MAKAELNNNKAAQSFREAQEYPIGTLCEGLNGGLFIVGYNKSTCRNSFISLRTGDSQVFGTVARRLLKSEKITLTNCVD